MRLLFLYPFRTSIDLKWLPLGAPTLIGNIKQIFPEIYFKQIDLEEEVKKYFDNKTKNEFYSVFNDYAKKGSIMTKKMEDIKRFRPFLEKIDELVDFSQYDHYFFTIYNKDKINFQAHYLLAKYLKEKYRNKKIILGGGTIPPLFIKELIIDSIVVGFRGEPPCVEIIKKLKQNKPIKKMYRTFPSTTNKYSGNLGKPDYLNFKNLENFRYSYQNLSLKYNTSLLPKSDAKILFIPYSFSSGCFWGKCGYCAKSGFKSNFNYYDVKKIIKDLKELKIKYNTRFFIFFNSNFNFNINFSKKLLKAIIDSNINILWTDSFNLKLLDEELIKLLRKAGCFRMDVGITSLNPRIQKLYNNILKNDDLNNLKIISSTGIWTHGNIISNLPYQYSIKKDIEVLKKYIDNIDGITLNTYRSYSSSYLERNYKEFNLTKIDQKTNTKPSRLIFIENDFQGGIKKREDILNKNYFELKKYLENNNVMLNEIHLYLMGYLYNKMGFSSKKEIRNILSNFYYYKNTDN